VVSTQPRWLDKYINVVTAGRVGNLASINNIYAINDCNVFRRQVQSAINEGCLTFHEMQVDKAPFPINTMDLQQPKVLVCPHQAEATKGKNVVIGEAKPDLRGKELVRKVEYEKTPDGKYSFKVIVSASRHGEQGSSTRAD
jgi:hypothetical protein